MDPEASKKMTPDTQDESEFLPENGEPEEAGGCTGVGHRWTAVSRATSLV